MSKTMVTVAEDKKTLVIERTFSAPKSKVWAAFTEKDIFTKWYAPKGWSTIVKKFNFVVGGETIYGMKCEDKSQGEWFGHTEWGKFIYTSIDDLSSYALMNHFIDENGNDQEGTSASSVTTTFSENAGKTLVVETDVYDSPEALQQVIEMGAIEGLKETWDQLNEMFEDTK